MKQRWRLGIRRRRECSDGWLGTRGKWGCRRGRALSIRRGEREREGAEKELAARWRRLPFKPAEKEMGRGVSVSASTGRMEKEGEKGGPSAVFDSVGRPAVGVGEGDPLSLVGCGREWEREAGRRYSNRI
jgi:hypothetical protein